MDVAGGRENNRRYQSAASAAEWITLPATTDGRRRCPGKPREACDKKTPLFAENDLQTTKHAQHEAVQSTAFHVTSRRKRSQPASSKSIRIGASTIGNESVPIQLAQCWFPGLALFPMLKSEYTLCLIKRIPNIFSCISSMHSWILIIFGRNISQKAGNSKVV